MGVLDGKVAIVTGAGSGIGRAAATRFASEGARVVAVDLGADSAAATAEAIGGVPVAGSVDEPDTWEAALAAASDLGGLHVVHLNAGLYGFDGPIDELPLDLFRQTVAANIGGVVLGVRAAVPVLRAAGGGAIVATASVAGIVPFSPNPIYTLTKQAVTGFVGALAPTLVADGISFDAVCPSIVDTPMTVGALGGVDPASIGLDVIAPETIAAEVLDLATTEGTGRCRAILAGVDPVDWPAPVWDDLLRRPAEG
jgi:NAD(P)-dependent dehydrogenase (short-subunit alcohol dehydrogenase family)